MQFYVLQTGAKSGTIQVTEKMYPIWLLGRKLADICISLNGLRCCLFTRKIPADH